MASVQPDTRRLIALHGPDQSGKDTTARIISDIVVAQNRTFHSKAFADLVKISLAAAFGIPASRAIAWCDDLKLSGEVEASTYRTTAVYSGRDFIKQFAEGHKALFGQQFWVDRILPYSQDYTMGGQQLWAYRFDLAQFCVIPDLRFQVEAARVQLLGGEIWCLTGRGSPTNGDFDVDQADSIIDNSGDFNDLKRQVSALLSRA
jgi:hypothetical protein